VCAGSDDEAGLNGLLRDPLIRLVMDSDGVTEQAMIALVEQVRRSLAARERQLSQVHKNCSVGQSLRPGRCPGGFQRSVEATGLQASAARPAASSSCTIWEQSVRNVSLRLIGESPLSHCTAPSISSVDNGW
jgi:hypothetical protein